MDTIIFSPPSLDTEISELPINHIILGALAPLAASAAGRAKTPTASTALTNHWVFHFIQDEKRSVRLYPAPSAAGTSSITLLFSEFVVDIPPDLVKTFRLPVQADLKLVTIIETIRGAMFLPYFLHASGHGRRYWIWHFSGFLTEIGVITSSHTLTGARICLQQVWLEDGRLAEEDQQTHLVPGTFPEHV